MTVQNILPVCEGQVEGEAIDQGVELEVDGQAVHQPGQDEHLRGARNEQRNRGYNTAYNYEKYQRLGDN